MTEPNASDEGLLHLLPIQLDRTIVNDRMVLSQLPWGAPSLVCIGGTEPSGTRVLSIGYEWPLPWLRVTQPLRKAELELIHLQRFRIDHLVAVGTVPFGDVREGSNPPDFVVATVDGPVNVDCAALAVSQRREALALFTEVRRRVFGAPELFMGSLAGYTVYLWFNDGDQLARPFRRNDQAATEELVAALAECHPDPSQLRVPTGQGLPERAPDPGLITTSSGASFYAIPFSNAVPETVLFTLTGFEMGLAYTTTHDKTSAWQELERLVADHDQPNIDWLLISAGAPSRFGHLFPSEEALMSFLLDNPQPLTAPRHLKRVTMHSWSSGRAVDLLPEVRELFSPLYQGMAVPHRPLQTATDRGEGAE